MARLNKHLKRIICQRGCILVTRAVQRMEQNPPTQCADPVLELGFFTQHPLANRLKMPDFDNAQFWRVLHQPVTQYGFGAHNHRCGVPQGVVEVESNQLNRHSLSLLRLARGWALS